MTELEYWLWLATRPRLGPVGMAQVLEHFGSPRLAYMSGPEEMEGLPDRLVRLLADRSMDEAWRVLERCQLLGLRIMTIEDEDYPQRLRQLADPPRVLYIRGELPQVDGHAVIGVVGTRRASGYGRRVAEYLGSALTQGGAVVASGLAAGIDTCALQGALRAGGTPVAVVGGGVDVPYPRENSGLYADIAAAGAVVSEYPPGTENRAGHFPVRNRIISGLSVGTVVVETDGTGGSMITAELVGRQGRDLFAVPGSIDAQYSRGCNELIRQGAAAVLEAGDVLAPYVGQYPVDPKRTAPMGIRPQVAYPVRCEPAPAPRQQERTQGEQITMAQLEDKPLRIQRGTGGIADDQLEILKAMGDEICQVDELAQRLGKDPRRVQGTLTMLTINGLARELPGKRFVSLVDEKL